MEERSCGWRKCCKWLNGSVRIDKTRIRNVSRPQMRNYEPGTGCSSRKQMEKNLELAVKREKKK